MKKCIVAGSFDPITYGHTWLIEQALKLFDHVTIVVAHNPSKKYMFSWNERLSQVVAAMNYEVLQPDPSFKQTDGEMAFGEAKQIHPKASVLLLNTEIALVNYAHENGIQYIVRGIRNAEDYSYEANLQVINKKINPNVETVFFTASADQALISSSMVKSLVGLQGWELVVDEFVPIRVMDDLKERVRRQKQAELLTASAALTRANDHAHKASQFS